MHAGMQKSMQPKNLIKNNVTRLWKLFPFQQFNLNMHVICRLSREVICCMHKTTIAPDHGPKFWLAGLPTCHRHTLIEWTRSEKNPFCCSAGCLHKHNKMDCTKTARECGGDAAGMRLCHCCTTRAPHAPPLAPRFDALAPKSRRR